MTKANPVVTDTKLADLLPTHFCVVCAARWIRHADGTWSVLTDCGPCCDNVPIDKAPIATLSPDGKIAGPDAKGVKEKYDRAQRQAQVERYRGICCALCDEPFEKHWDDWTCPRRVAPKFKFPPEAATRPATDTAVEEAGVRALHAARRVYCPGPVWDDIDWVTQNQWRLCLRKALEAMNLSPTTIPQGAAEGLARSVKRVQLALDTAKANDANTLLVTTLEAERLIAAASRHPTADEGDALLREARDELDWLLRHVKEMRPGAYSASGTLAKIDAHLGGQEHG